MKRRCTTVIALAMAFTLAVPAVTGTDSAAAGKAPKLTLKDGDAVIIGKPKTFKVRNVKKSNVKDLKVKVYNKSVCKLVGKKKTSFKLKAVGGGYCSLDVILNLKKPQAGKKTYKFKDLVVACGSDETPVGSVIDTVTGYDETAIVLKAGTDPAADGFVEDNYLSYDINDIGMIGARNIMVTWYEDGKELEDWTNDAAGRMFRPETKDVVIDAPATGSAVQIPASGSAANYDNHPLPPTHSASGAAAGLVERTYYAVFENMLSGKKSESQKKICRIVPQFYIDGAMELFQTFLTKHPYKSAAELPSDAAGAKEYMHEFIRYAHSMGMCLGLTTELNDFIARSITEANDPTVAAAALTELVEPLSKGIAGVGKYLGIKDELVNAYLSHYAFIVQRSITDKTYDVSQLHYK